MTTWTEPPLPGIVCGYEWVDGWGEHRCSQPDEHEGDHRCHCDFTTRRRNED